MELFAIKVQYGVGGKVVYRGQVNPKKTPPVIYARLFVGAF
jgi:hypothetical protein